MIHSAAERLLHAHQIRTLMDGRLVPFNLITTIFANKFYENFRKAIHPSF